MATTEELLVDILAELRRSRSQPLGFGHPPKARFIFANRQYNDCLWYFWLGDKNTHEPIEHTALTGTIEKLEIEEKTFRGKPDPKVNLHIRADRPYVIQAGFDTLFAKGLLFSLDALSKGELSGVVTIAVEPGETEQVLFCRVYVGDRSVFAPYEESVNWHQVIASIKAKLGASDDSPVEPSTAPIAAHPVTGQTELIPDERGGIADKLGTMIKQMSAQEVDAVFKKLNEWRKELGENAYTLLYQKWKARSNQLKPIDRTDVIAAITVEMDRLEWTTDDGRDYLLKTYSKRKRAELEDAQLVEFLGYLKGLRSGLVGAGVDF
jgi:hypothetical protein